MALRRRRIRSGPWASLPSLPWSSSDRNAELGASSLVFRFVTFGAMIYTFYGFEAAANSLRTVGQFTEFTLVILRSERGIGSFQSGIPLCDVRGDDLYVLWL